MNIPMVDLKQQYEKYKNEFDVALHGVLDSTQFILGPNVQALEEEVAAFLGAEFAVSCGSGTDALHLALLAAGIGAGDEVITSPFTFIATAEAIAYVGARPVFVDVDEKTFNLDTAKIESAITDRTRAILPVHLFGQPSDMDAIIDICNRYDLKLIEDCAQSFGARYGDRSSGTFGQAGCYSFFPSKNLGCFGDGGMVTTNDADIAQELKVLRNHGSRERYHHSVIGYNSRLDELQAAVLRVKLRYIDAFNQHRHQNAQTYHHYLKDHPVITPYEGDRRTHVYHQYTIRLKNRHKVQSALSDAGVASAVYYPIPLHRQEVFRDQYPEACPVAEDLAQSVLSLPMYPELTEEQIRHICQIIGDSLE